MNLIVRFADDADAGAWDAFVLALPEATFFHRYGWRRLFAKLTVIVRIFCWPSGKG
jgi:hypothetical protein